DRRLVQMALDDVEVLRELGENQGLGTLTLELFQTFQQDLELRAESTLLAGIEQARVTGSLSQTEQAGEQHGRALLVVPLRGGLRILVAQLSVKLLVPPPLRRTKLDVQGLLDPRGQVGFYLVLGAPEHEGLDEAFDDLALRGVEGARLAKGLRAQPGLDAEPGIYEIQERPQLAEVVFDG